MHGEAVRFEKARAGQGRAGGTGQPEVVDMSEDPLAQGAEQPATARFRTQVGIAQANHVGMLLQADEPQYPRVPLAAEHEPAVVGTVAQRVAAAFAAHPGAGEEAAHAGEEGGLVVERAPLQDLAVLRADHERFSRPGTSLSISVWEKPKDSERAMSCFSRDSAIRRQDGCLRRFSRAGIPASGQMARG